MLHIYIKRLTTLMVQRPWLALCALLLFGAGVVLFEVRNLKGEGSFITTLATEKGNAFVTIIENALRVTPERRWNDGPLHTLMTSLGSDKDLHFLAVVDGAGKVLLGTGDVSPGQQLWAAPPPSALTGVEADWRHERHFRVSRRLQAADSSPSAQAGFDEPLWVVAGFNMQAIVAARDADRRHLFIITLVLLLAVSLCAVAWRLMRKHLRSLQLAQEATAFSSHIVRNLPVGIIATDTAWAITSINAEAARILGLPASSVVPAATGDTPPTPCRLPEEWAPLLHSLRSGAALKDVEMRCAFAREKALPLSVSASSLITETGQSLGYVFIVRDLGEIRHLQAELRRRDRLAALGTLAAGIAHEVRNPLSAIRGIARYFKECHSTDAEEQDMSRILEQEVLRLDKVVCNLLDLARPDTLVRTRVPLDELVERARRMALPALSALGVDFVARLPQPSPHLLVDGDRVAQVLLNIFLNAAEAMRDSPRRELELRAALEKDTSGAWLVVEVADTGSGIPPEAMQDIFSPYYTTKAQGTGLGLAIVHKIVEAHGGSIVAQNRRQGGCVMTFRLLIPPEQQAS